MSQAAFGGARALTSSAGGATYGSVKEGDTALRTASFRCLLQIDVWPCTQNWTTLQLTCWFSFHLWAEEAQAHVPWDSASQGPVKVVRVGPGIQEFSETVEPRCREGIASRFASHRGEVRTGFPIWKHPLTPSNLEESKLSAWYHLRSLAKTYGAQDRAKAVEFSETRDRIQFFAERQ